MKIQKRNVVDQKRKKEIIMFNKKYKTRISELEEIIIKKNEIIKKQTIEIACQKNDIYELETTISKMRKDSEQLTKMIEEKNAELKKLKTNKKTPKKTSTNKIKDE